MKKTIVLTFVTIALLAIATIAATYNVQTVEAKSEKGDNFGQNAASEQATDGGNDRNPGNGNGLTANSDQSNGNDFGGIVSGCAKTSPHCG